MRLIDADELLNKTIKLEAEARKQVANYEPIDNPKKWHIWNGVLAERTAFKYDLMDAPTVDAVEVVRCKDCKNYWKSAGICCFADMPINDSVMPEDYCSRGERKEDETDCGAKMSVEENDV